MRYTHIRNCDLNLLVSFQALIEERNITRAGRKMSLSQPAMSRLLDRVRQTFNDEILVRTAAGYEATGRALQIYAELERLLPRIEELLQGEKFVPASASNTFRIAATDSTASLLLPGVLSAIARSAPRVQIEVSTLHSESFQEIQADKLDLALWADRAPGSLRSELLFRERFVCLMRADHPLTRRRMNLQRYLEQRHIAVSFTQGRQGVIEQTLNRLGLRRNIQLLIPYFASVMPIVEETDMIATLPALFAKQLLKRSRTRILPTPVEIPELSHILVWHPRHDSDVAHKWLRELIKKQSSEKF